MTDTYYHFLSVGRQGLAAAIDTKLEPGQKRASIDAILNMKRKSKSTGTSDEISSIQRPVQLYGPGDNLGFDKRIVARTDPKPDTGNFEPNYFPQIEFVDFDFPWRYSPEPADDDKGLTPWIVLIALIAEDRGEDIRREYEEVARGKDQLPVIKVYDQENLPDLSNAWRWVHVQATSGHDVLNDDQLKEIYETQPERLVSRLLCPRRLQPKTLYTAFVVPAYKLGWAAGLGDEITLSSVIDSTADDPAWTIQAGESLELPYYYRWDFRTSLRGDFEHLVRLLEPRVLEGLGLRKMDCEHPGYGLCVQRSDTEEDETRHLLNLEGALQSYDTNYTPWGKDKNGPLDSLAPEEYPEPEEFQDRLAFEILNKANVEPLIRSIRINPAIYDTEGFDVAYRPGFNAKSADTSKEDISVEPIIRKVGVNPAIRDVEGYDVTYQPGSEAESSDISKIGIIKDFIKGISFNTLPDGKSVRLSWQTPVKTIVSIRYGAEKPSGKVTYDHIRSSDTYSRSHSVVITLAPEKVYWLKLRIINHELGLDCEAITASICITLPAVVPPIYGRWHAARSNVVSDKNSNAWLDVLNLDPRHRAAAGLGSLVVRKQQEALMSSAWDQIGDIETANDILRRAQLGRESCIFLHDRLGSMALEDYLRVTAPVQKRILREQNGGKKQTIRAELEKNTIIPAAALDPAFRRISRARGPIRKRQKQRRMDLLRRMAKGELQPAGEPPKIMGTIAPCDITKEMIQGVVPTISLDIDDIEFNEPLEYEDGVSARFTFTLSWDSNNTIGQPIASGDWSGIKQQRSCQFSVTKNLTGVVMDTSATPQMDSGLVGLSNVTSPSDTGTSFDYDDPSFITETTIIQHNPITFTFSLTGESFAYKQTTTRDVTIEFYSDPGSAKISDPRIEIEPKEIAIDESALRFCDERITCDQIRDALDAGVEGVTIENELLEAICDAFSNFLIPEEDLEDTPYQEQDYFEDLRSYIHAAIDPRKTIVERVKQRLKLNSELAIRFEEDAKGDPLDGIKAYPEFPQPMYVPLQELSESHILPGVEKVPQNTIGLLETNRRFLESYMVGLNHEFSAELLWREFPTDQRGSYFRQFWDVSEHIDTRKSRWGELQIEAEEHLKDILPLTEWKDSEGNESRLGKNDTKLSGEITNYAVLVIRGDLLKRYPNAVIYAVNARLEYDPPGELTGNFIPDLAEFRSLTFSGIDSGSTKTTGANETGHAYKGEMENTIAEGINHVVFRKLESLPPDPGPAEPIKPTFGGALGTDLVFLGFPFSVDDAKSSSETTGKFFVFEERITETRFGLDLPDETLPEQEVSEETATEETETEETITIQSWDNLSWGDFGLADKPGKYLDSSIITEITLKKDAENGEGEIWYDDASAAFRARVTMQKPVRLAVHADQMLPELTRNRVTEHGV